MTLRDLLDQITLEGYYKIQCWYEDINYLSIYYEGYGLPPDMMEQYGNRKIRYIFPYMVSKVEAAITIELEEED